MMSKDQTGLCPLPSGVCMLHSTQSGYGGLVLPGCVWLWVWVGVGGWVGGAMSDVSAV
jgi:hypothetical protein